MDEEQSWQEAMTGYGRELERLLAQYPNANLLELGAGRWPSFRLDEFPSNIQSYTLNDISEEELSLIPDGYEKACFDVCGDSSEFTGKFDVVISRFLAEHVRDGARMHRNVFEVLKPGGMAFHLIPTLYASPFIINKLMPEFITSHALNILTPRRAISPKFPAYYSQCYGDTSKMRRLFKSIGYSKISIRSFFGHFYYEKIPLLSQLQNLVADVAAKNKWNFLSSYVYITAYK